MYYKLCYKYTAHKALYRQDVPREHAERCAEPGEHRNFTEEFNPYRAGVSMTHAITLGGILKSQTTTV